MKLKPLFVTLGRILEELTVLNCDDCGACCTAMGHPHFYRTSGKDPHWSGLPEVLKQQVNEHIDALSDIDLGRPCIWLDPETRKCLHYQHRPQVCRDFEIGNPHCLRMREWQGISKSF